MAPNPPLVMPPQCRPGSISTTDLPIFAACTAATTPPDVPPYTHVRLKRPRGSPGGRADQLNQEPGDESATDREAIREWLAAEADEAKLFKVSEAEVAT